MEFAFGWSATPSAQAFKAARDEPGYARDTMRVRRAAARDFESMSVRVADWIVEAKAWRRLLEEWPPTREFLEGLLEECVERCSEIGEWREAVEVEEPAPWLVDFEKRHWAAFMELQTVGPPPPDEDED